MKLSDAEFDTMPSKAPAAGPRFGWALVAVAYALIGLGCWSLSGYPVGMRGRPMGEAALLFFGGVIGLFAAPISLIEAFSVRPRWPALLASILGLAALPAGLALFRLIGRLRGYVYLP